MRNYFIFLLIGLFFLISACEESAVEKEDSLENDQEKEEEVASEEEKTNNELSLEEVREIIEQREEEEEKILEQVLDNHFHDFSGVNWGVEVGEDDQEFDKAVGIVREELSEVMTADMLDEEAETITIATFCECDAYYSGMESVDARLEIVEQTEEYFQVKFLSIEPMGMDEQGGIQNVWDFKLEDQDTWKLDQKQAISPEEEPLNLTVDDMKEVYNNWGNSVEFVEEREYEDENYLVFKDSNDFYNVWNVKDASTNYDLRSEYNDDE
ncbi:hypothetical protein [Alkalibacillus haloalkaliphilus]|uniref:hypothetical protein n=1 Tax=Alkalibacillus haloalkaliphilus TaxID=94136 RepID=UPI000495E8C8|nr:hypothetical protein [Alkalibacillus haloalkaliphilus]